MLFLFTYVFLYCNIDNILNTFYLPIFDTFNNSKNEFIENNIEFYYSVKILNNFILCIYSLYIMYYLFFSKRYNYTSLSLAFIYTKYTLYPFIHKNITIYEFEYSRYIMWLFATPLMLNMYCEVNNITLMDINFHYHIIPIFMNVILYPYQYSNPNIYNLFYLFSYISFTLFIITLYKKRYNKFTNIYIYIWFLFVIISILELTNFFSIYYINLLYLTADMIGKITTNFVIHDYNEQQFLLLNNIDLQAINFISKLLKVIVKYKNDNKIITEKCNNFINYIHNKFTNKIPYNKDKLKLELLKKILPFGMDTNYINFDDKSIQQDMICILFTDIVSYTELAKLYDDKTIFNLLNDIYHTFDIIIKKYNYLQKIETIGDAYMVVGDIYRNTDNYKLAVKEIILLAIEFIKEIKNIKTPDNNELSIRIGINIGPVSIGILGSEIPRLCIVGNTVNIAARLQSTADIDTIQISSSLYEILEEISPDIVFDKRENVFLKHIGSVDTYNYKAL